MYDFFMFYDFLIKKINYKIFHNLPKIGRLILQTRTAAKILTTKQNNLRNLACESEKSDLPENFL